MIKNQLTKIQYFVDFLKENAVKRYRKTQYQNSKTSSEWHVRTSQNYSVIIAKPNKTCSVKLCVVFYTILLTTNLFLLGFIIRINLVFTPTVMLFCQRGRNNQPQRQQNHQAQSRLKKIKNLLFQTIVRVYSGLYTSNFCEISVWQRKNIVSKKNKKNF